MSDYEWPTHPAADLFPLLEDDELNELAHDIRTHGLLEPIWLWQDPEQGVVLLDGRNRFRACRIADVPVRTRRYEGDDPIDFSVSLNAKRRHLTVGQRAAVATEVEPLYAIEAAKRKAQAAGQPRGKKQSSLGADRPQEKKKRAPLARDRAAKSAGTSGRSVARFKSLVELG